MSRRFRLLCSVSPRCLRVNLTPSLQYFYLNLRRSSGSSGDEWVILTSGDPAALIFQCNCHENEILTDEKFRQVNALIPFSNSACSIKSIDFKSEFSPNGFTRKQGNKSRTPSFACNYHHHQCCRPWSEKHWSGLTGPSVSQSVCQDQTGSSSLMVFFSSSKTYPWMRKGEIISGSLRGRRLILGSLKRQTTKWSSPWTGYLFLCRDLGSVSTRWLVLDPDWRVYLVLSFYPSLSRIINIISSEEKSKGKYQSSMLPRGRWISVFPWYPRKSLHFMRAYI